MDSAIARIPALARTGHRRCSTTARRASPRTTSSSSARPPSCGTSSSRAGFNSVGIASAGGAGRALAEWITRGRAETGPDRGRHPPLRRLQRQQPVAARPGRRGPRPALRGAVAEPRAGHRPAVPPLPGLPPARPGGACFGSKMGWERANFFAAARAAARSSSTAGDKQNWQPWSSAEQRAARTARRPVRPDQLLQVPGDRPGRRAGAAVAVHRRRRGRSRAGPSTPGCSTRAAPTRPTSPSPGCRRTSSCWSAAPRRPNATRTTSPGGSRAARHASLVDVTSAYAVYGVMGPRSRELLSRLSRSRPQRRGVPVRLQPRDRPRLRHGPRDQDHLRGRARLGAVRPGRVRGRRLRGPDRPRAPTSAWSTPATTRSSRCGWRRRTGPSAAS